MAFVYRNRWKPVVEAMRDLDAKTLEAEALWDQPIRAATDQLRQVVVAVNSAIDAYLKSKADPDSGKRCTLPYVPEKMT
jgi:hypothetical protein